MSLLLIVRKLWKYRFFTLPIFALVIAGSVYVLAIKAPTYESDATYLLVNPPTPPTDGQIAANPALGRIDSDNPYLRFSNLTVVVQVLVTRLSSEEGRKALVNQGADPNYTVESSPEFGFSAPLIRITGTGTTPAAAVHTANLVGEAMTEELDRMQAIRGVDKLYRINAEVVVGAHDATLKASGQLRALIAVFALGTILMFIAVSVLEAVGALRMQGAQRRREDAEGELSSRLQDAELGSSRHQDRDDSLDRAADDRSADVLAARADTDSTAAEDPLAQGELDAECEVTAEEQLVAEEHVADGEQEAANDQYGAAEGLAGSKHVVYASEEEQTKEVWDLYIVEYPPAQGMTAGNPEDDLLDWTSDWSLDNLESEQGSAAVGRARDG
jgi:hypothetical protein